MTSNLLTSIVLGMLAVLLAVLISAPSVSVKAKITGAEENIQQLQQNETASYLTYSNVTYQSRVNYPSNWETIPIPPIEIEDLIKS